MSIAVQKIPEALIYEMVDGAPIYYKGYKDYLHGSKQLEELMGSSKLQALIVAELIFLLRSFLGDDYLLFTNEVGLQFSKKSWRAADIAVIKAEKVDRLDDKYLAVAPELVIEIDTKAELKDIKHPLSYYQQNTEDLLQFGVEKVIWIFTDTEKIMVAERGKPWVIGNWGEEVEIIDGLRLKLGEVVERRGK